MRPQGTGSRSGCEQIASGSPKGVTSAAPAAARWRCCRVASSRWGFSLIVEPAEEGPVVMRERHPESVGNASRGPHDTRGAVGGLLPRSPEEGEKIMVRKAMLLLTAMVGALAGETAMAVSVSCASDPDAQCYGTRATTN